MDDNTGLTTSIANEMLGANAGIDTYAQAARADMPPRHTTEPRMSSGATHGDRRDNWKLARTKRGAQHTRRERIGRRGRERASLSLGMAVSCVKGRR